MQSISSLGASFARHQRAEGNRPATIRCYGAAIARLSAHTSDDLAACTRRELADYFGARLEVVKASSVLVEWRALRVFFGWLVEEAELPASPMAGMRPPKVAAKPPALYSDADVDALLKACEGASFLDRRDMAIIRLLLDTGLRRGELAGLKVGDVDLDNRLAVVSGKTGTRTIPLSSQAANALDRYMRVRAHRSDAERPELWLGHFGPLTASGLYQALRERSAGKVTNAYLHRFRHGFAHRMLSAGMAEGDLMRIAGWQSRSMLDRYGASAAATRAIDAYRKLVA